MPDAHSPSVNVLLLTGPLFIANLFNWVLFGMLTVQVYIYYIAFPKDHWRLKSVVSLSYALDVVQLIIATRDAYKCLATGWGDLNELDQVRLMWLSVPIFTAIISCLSQLFYAWRIYMLSSSRWASIFISLTAAAQLGLGIYDGITVSRSGPLSALTHDPVLRRSSAAWIGLGTICDLFITTGMVYYLWKARREVAAPRTLTIVTRLIKLTVETGMICTTGNLLTLVFFLASTNTLVFSIFLTSASKLYSNSLVAILNSRVHIMGGRNNITEMSNPTFFAPRNETPVNYLHNWSKTPVEVHIEVSRDSDSNTTGNNTTV